MAKLKSIEAKVRPVPNTSLEKSNLSGAAHVYINRDSFLALIGSFTSGKLCEVERLTDEEGQEPLRREAALYIVPEKNISPNVVAMTRAYQEATGFKIGDKIRLTVAGDVPEAEAVVLQDITQEEPDDSSGKYPPSWENAIMDALGRAKHVFPGMVLDGLEIRGSRRSFKVMTTNSKTANLTKFQPSSTVIHITKAADESSPEAQECSGDLVLTGVPGLSAQMEKINMFLRGIGRPFHIRDESRSNGLVIHGGHGTGKTFICQRLANTGWGRSFWIKPSDKLSAIREVFDQARGQQPSMVFIDGLGDLINKDRSNHQAVIETIGEELDRLSAEAKENQALSRIVVIVTTLDYMTDVPHELQQLSRLYEHVTLPIPRASERLEILKSLDLPIKDEEKDEVLEGVAQKTHAYNGADLEKLVHNAKGTVKHRIDKEIILGTYEGGEENYLTRSDFEKAFHITRPTAMHDINLKPPTIHWKDVGGQEALKKVLTRMIKNTKSTNPSMRQVLPDPPKGLLLYGPPGCSKTLSAQAMATESGFNFFAVKGAELLNMYVGESERAVRTLFERARAAAPAIIFFDEIDSIGGQRSGPGSGASRSAGAVNMLTTLLTEMDGFETLTGVLILAATNRPESMDPALLRPGRFDQVVYVGPPDQAAREAVFNVHLRKVNLADDVDIPQLALLAEGFSGAEIKAICNAAGLAVLDRDEDEEQGRLEIKMADLVTALETVPRGITRQMIEGYENWSKQFRRT